MPSKHPPEISPETPPKRRRRRRRPGPKTTTTSIRLTEEGHAQLARAAERHGVPRATFLRLLILSPKRCALSAEELALLRQTARALADVGRNLNQIARHYNSRFPEHVDPSHDITTVRALALSVQKTITKALA